MQNQKKMLTILFFLLLPIHSAFAGPEGLSKLKPKTIRFLAENTFLPVGFGDNDNVQIILDGYLPNTCYKAGPATAQVDAKEKKIYIENSAYLYPGCWCLEVETPYMQVINLGILSGGDYQVLALDQDGIPHEQGILPVGVSAEKTQDDFLYAPVEDVLFHHREANQESGPSITLRGHFNSPQMKFHEVRVLNRFPNIIEILPISDIDSQASLGSVRVFFEEKVPLESPWKGRTLIYVRSLNGQSISKVVDLD